MTGIFLLSWIFTKGENIKNYNKISNNTIKEFKINYIY